MPACLLSALRACTRAGLVLLTLTCYRFAVTLTAYVHLGIRSLAVPPLTVDGVLCVCCRIDVLYNIFPYPPPRGISN